MTCCAAQAFFAGAPQVYACIAGGGRGYASPVSAGREHAPAPAELARMAVPALLGGCAQSSRPICYVPSTEYM